jgi:diaminopimelate decarboxylase
VSEPADAFHYRGGDLYCEDVPVGDLCAKHGTPLYIYSHAALTGQYEALATAFGDADVVICYSVKSNSNLAVVRSLARIGSGADIVSGGELRRALKAGVPADKLVFAGVGKTDGEIADALAAGILLFNIESVPEAHAIDRVAAGMGVMAPVALRVNPDVDAQTHRHTTTGKKGTKFGVDIDRALDAYKELSELANLDLCGVHVHLGSPVTTLDAYDEALNRIGALISSLRDVGIDSVRMLNFGGGLPIVYKDEPTIDLADYAACLRRHADALGCRLILEPGRFISGNSGIMCAQVVYRKEAGHKTFIIVDGAMNDLIRPAFYESYHAIRAVSGASRDTETVDVVGPVCESGDFLAKDREMERLEEGDMLAVFSAGAYGFVMSSNYNSRPRAAEVLVMGDQASVVRQRETVEDLFRGESIPSALQ